MKPARLIVMSIALVAALAAGYLILNITSQTQEPTVRQVVKKVKTETVLVAASSLPIGSRLDKGNLDWQDWPEHAVTDGYITRSTRPDAVKELTGSIVRLPVFEGEPVRTEKIVDAGTRIMSSMLPSGKRAVAHRDFGLNRRWRLYPSE